MNYNPVEMRACWESKEYYEIRGKIMAECYLRGWEVKEITGYFKVGYHQFYRYCNVKKIKAEKYKTAYKELMTKDATENRKSLVLDAVL